MLAHNLLVLTALAATAAPLPPDDPSGLRWKFEKGHTFYQEVTTHTRQTMKVMGQEVKQTQEQTFILSWTPEKEDGDRWLLKCRIEGVKMEIDIGGTPISYDSTKPKVRVTLDRRFQVQKVEGRDDLVKKLTADRPETRALMQGLLNEDVLKEMTNPMLVTVPRRGLGKGDYWVCEKTTDLGPIGKWVGRWQYVHAGRESRLVKLKLDVLNFELQPPRDDGPSPLPFHVRASDFKTSKTTGVILFDADKGRPHSAEMSMDLEGDLTIEIGGQESKVHLSQTQKTTYKASDTNPLLK